MKIPKIISKNEHEYIFQKQVNDRIFLYEDMKYHIKECIKQYFERKANESKR